MPQSTITPPAHQINSVYQLAHIFRSPATCTSPTVASGLSLGPRASVVLHLTCDGDVDSLAGRSSHEMLIAWGPRRSYWSSCTALRVDYESQHRYPATIPGPGLLDRLLALLRNTHARSFLLSSTSRQFVVYPHVHHGAHTMHAT